MAARVHAVQRRKLVRNKLEFNHHSHQATHSRCVCIQIYPVRNYNDKTLLPTQIFVPRAGELSIRSTSNSNCSIGSLSVVSVRRRSEEEEFYAAGQLHQVLTGVYRI